MEIGPLLPGRLPNSLVSERLKTQLNGAHFDLARLQEQISTGQKFFLPSDSPSAALRTISLQSLDERKTQMTSNVQTSKSLLSATESALASVSDALNRAKQLSAAGVGNTSTPAEKSAMALEVQSLIRQVSNAGNTTFRGRYLFAGSETTTTPFTMMDGGTVRYNGDQLSLDSYIDLALMMPNNVDGHAAFGALTPPAGGDVDPALSLSTKLSDLLGGEGVTPGQISITLSSPASTQVIDLSKAKTVGDLKTLIENALGAANVTVAVNATNDGISITPAAGTITLADVGAGDTARTLGLTASAATSIDSGDLNPRLTASTNLADLNGGTGIGATAGNGLRIVNGDITQVIDLAGAVTVEDLLNLLRDPDLALSAEINPAGNGLSVSSRISGVDFSIGENNGQNATLLGLRTMTGGTPLASLNYGAGVTLDSDHPLKLTRRDGTAISIDLTGALTVQDVLTKINAVDPGNLVASLNTVGNGISLLDNSGTGPLTVDAIEPAMALGMDGTEIGVDNTVPLVGRDVNPQEVSGVLNVLVRLQKALETNDNVELSRVNGLVDKELTRVTRVRGDLGARLKTLEEVDNRLQEENLHTQQALSDEFGVDMAQALTDLLSRQSAYEATLKIAAQTLQMTLANYL